MIISFLNQKGGVGKTTLCVNMASYWAARGGRILVVDADPQGSLLDWSAMRNDPPLFPVIGMPKPTLHKELGAVARDYDLTLIDCPPRSDAIARSAIMASDLILIPVQPSPVDVWAADDTVALLQEMEIYRSDFRAAFIVNRKIPNTVIGRDVHTAFAPHPYPLLEIAVCQRVIFAETAARGLSVIEHDPHGKAALEIGHIADAVARLREEVGA